MQRWLPILLFGTIACGPPAWKEAQRQGTAQAYEQFALQHSNYPQSKTALNRAESLRWKQASEAGTAAGWSSYLRMHHTSGRAAQARSTLDDIAYREAVEDGDDLAIERYMAMFPDGKHRKDARGHLDAARWQKAKSEDTHVSYRRYLLQEPDGANRQRASERYHDRVWERAARVDTLRSYALYLGEFPTGEEAGAAAARVAELQFSELDVAVALRGSWQSNRKTALSTLRAEVLKYVVPILKTNGFTVKGSVQSADIGAEGNPLTAFAAVQGRGLAVIVIDDSRGEEYKPRGHATEMQGEILIFSAARAEAMASWKATGVTSDSVRSINEHGLYKDAAKALAIDASGEIGRIRAWHPSPP